MSPKRPTGTVPKAKTSSRTKNAVPQEMVAPTRRDLQQHLNVNIRLFIFLVEKQKSFYSIVEPMPAIEVVADLCEMF